jgi:DNA mismatch repair protein MutS
MPAAVLHQARRTLDALEAQSTQSRAQVDLFAAAPKETFVTPSAVEAAVAALNPDAMSPREAMEAIYQLKALSARK